MTTFGEIVEPGTRTAWEDWDETTRESSKLIWQKEVKVPENVNILIILEGRHIANSFSTLNNLKLKIINTIPEVNLKLYRTEERNNYVCILSDYNLLLSSEIIELLKVYITLSTDVIAILTKPLVEYQAFNTAQEYVIRSMATSKLTSTSLANKIPKLEQPNIISGVTAGVISLRQILDKSGAAIICYVEHNEEYQITEVQDLLQKLNFGPVQTSSKLNSNLYI